MLLPSAVPVSGASANTVASSASSSFSDGYFLDRRFASFLNLSEGKMLKLIEESSKGRLRCLATAHLLHMGKGFFQIAFQGEALFIPFELSHERFPIGEGELDGLGFAGAVGDVLDGDVHGLNLCK